MTQLTYRDIPVLRSAGFKVGNSGYCWWGKDRYGGEWKAVIDDEKQGPVMFTGPSKRTEKLHRETFDQLFVQLKYR